MASAADPFQGMGRERWTSATVRGEPFPPGRRSRASGHEAGDIAHARGWVHVFDRGGLVRATCDCYRVVRDKPARLLAPA